MTGRLQKNIPASIKQLLLNKARQDGRPFNDIQQHYAMERFLYRLSVSRHAEAFILKGALMLEVWCARYTRPTMDIDLLGVVRDDEDSIKSIITEVLALSNGNDGLTFDPSSLHSERIKEEADYQGMRLRFLAYLGKAKINLQIDLAFGDSVIPSAEIIDFPTILSLPAPHLYGYSRESAIAEKLEAMVRLDIINSRMNDFFDIWLLSYETDFTGEILAQAINSTFRKRATEIPEEIVAFSDGFIAAKQALWKAFQNRLKQEDVPGDFDMVIEGLRAFIMPILSASKSGKPFDSHWIAPGPWSCSSDRL